MKDQLPEPVERKTYFLTRKLIPSLDSSEGERYRSFSASQCSEGTVIAPNLVSHCQVLCCPRSPLWCSSSGWQPLMQEAHPISTVPVLLTQYSAHGWHTIHVIYTSWAVGSGSLRCGRAATWDRGYVTQEAEFCYSPLKCWISSEGNISLYFHY